MNSFRRARRAFTLPEVALTIGLAIMLSAGGVYSAFHIRKIRSETQIHVALETVLAAQRAYLIDHPDQAYEGLTLLSLAPYFPGGVQPPLPSESSLVTSSYPPVVSWQGIQYRPKEF